MKRGKPKYFDMDFDAPSHAFLLETMPQPTDIHLDLSDPKNMWFIIEHDHSITHLPSRTSNRHTKQVLPDVRKDAKVSTHYQPKPRSNSVCSNIAPNANKRMKIKTEGIPEERESQEPLQKIVKEKVPTKPSYQKKRLLRSSSSTSLQRTQNCKSFTPGMCPFSHKIQKLWEKEKGSQWRSLKSAVEKKKALDDMKRLHELSK